MDKLGEAMEYTTSIQNSFIENPDFIFMRGLVIIYNGNPDMGKKYITNALSKDPDNPKFQRFWRNYLKTEKLKKEGNDLFSAGQYSEAIEKFGECLLLDQLNKTYNQTILFNRASAYIKVNKLDEAVKDLDQAILMNSNYVKAYLKRGEIQLSLERYEEAVRDFSQAK